MRATELTLYDLKQIITQMCPIKIFVNNILIWDDDVDLTNMSSYEAAMEAMAKNEKEYQDVFSDPRYILNINFEITSYHHTIVRITTI